jgi:RNA polymerase sigma-70 factor (ECF subfamily)
MTDESKTAVLDDAAIIALYFARDERAIAETANAHGAYCFGVAMRILRSHLDSEECVNDTWLRAWSTIPPKRPSVLRTYLAHIIRNLAISRYRREHAEKRSHAPDSPLHELAECLPDPDGSPAEAVSSGELRALLNRFVSELSEEDRKLFVGRYFHSYTPRQLAEAYGLKENTLNQRLFRIRERLRKQLAERGYRV